MLAATQVTESANYNLLRDSLIRGLYLWSCNKGENYICSFAPVGHEIIPEERVGNYFFHAVARQVHGDPDPRGAPAMRFASGWRIA